MPVQAIPFTGSNQNTDEGMQNNLGYELYNGIVDELGNLRRIPGYTQLVDLGSGYGITGLHYNEKNNKIVVVTGLKIYLIDKTGMYEDITGTGIPSLSTLCKFADFADTVYMVNGGDIIKIPMTGGTTSVLSGTYIPSNMTNIANLNSYLLANNGTAGKVQFTNAATPEDWSVNNFFTFEASNDQLQFFGVGEGYDRITGFGTKSVESWRNDGVTPFIPEGQEYVNRGSISPYSPVWILDTWYFVDEFKNLCRLQGRLPQRLPAQNYRGLTAFLQPLFCEDIEGMHVYADGYHWYVANLPTEQKTFAYNIDLDQWAQWSFWDTLKAEHAQYKGRVAAHATGWQKTLIGDIRDSKIYTMNNGQNTYNSAEIRTSIRTGFISRGSEARQKFCSRITGRVIKKNVSSPDNTLQLTVRWRDKKTEGAWKQRNVNLYKEDDTNYYFVVNGLGSYKRRQWEFICTGDIDFQLMPPEEEFTVGAR